MISCGGCRGLFWTPDLINFDYWMSYKPVVKFSKLKISGKRKEKSGFAPSNKSTSDDVFWTLQNICVAVKESGSASVSAWPGNFHASAAHVRQQPICGEHVPLSSAPKNAVKAPWSPSWLSMHSDYCSHLAESESGRNWFLHSVKSFILAIIFTTTCVITGCSAWRWEENPVFWKVIRRGWSWAQSSSNTKTCLI